MFAAFAVLALYTFGRAVYDIGRNDLSLIHIWRREPPYFLSVSMMADKESSKETFVQSAITKKSARKTCGG